MKNYVLKRIGDLVLYSVIISFLLGFMYVVNKNNLIYAYGEGCYEASYNLINSLAANPNITVNYDDNGLRDQCRASAIKHYNGTAQ